MRQKQVNLRLGQSLLDAIEDARGDLSRNAWICATLSEHVNLRDDSMMRLIDKRIDERVDALRLVGATHMLDARAA
jgi:hypothetical protein